ncbi:MAG: beta-L-arabinofuranosidase domain-containing protein [Eubacteriales bacterium]
MSDNFTKGKLLKIPYAILPTGAVKPKGWLLDQLNLQAKGFASDMESYPDYGKDSAWKGGNGENWEDGPYYLRGLVCLAYVLEDQTLIDRAKVWIEAILASQREDGMFGPTTNEDWWSRMPVLMALRDYYEATERMGCPDGRILPFMESYFRGQLKNLPGKPLESWAKARGGDNLDSVLWLYNRLYREDAPNATDWLLELAALLREQTTDWVRLMHETTVRTHVVNTSQAMKTPPLYYLLSNDSADRSALKSGLRHISVDHGRIDGLPNSDEAARDNQSTRGSELCGIVEGMLSTEIAFSILGDAYLCDRLETLAYNALPAAYAPDYSGHVYFILQNQVLATTGYHEFDCDHGDSSAFAAPCGFDCCFANNHMGWAKFVKSMWMAEQSGGLAIVAYGPSYVETALPDGKIARFTEETEYPFRDSVRLTYGGETAEFALCLPIPAWCKNAGVTVNGEAVEGLTPGNIRRVYRQWNEGDVVEITLPMEPVFSEWYNRSVAVTRGPLIYSLKIDEEWVPYSDNSTREIKADVFGCVKKQEVYPKSRWNYALLPDADEMTVETRPLTKQPFTSDSAPVVLKAKGQIVPEWRLDGNRAASQPFGGVTYDETAQSEIELIPYGAARLKITHFPRISDDVNRIYRDDPIVSRTSDQTRCEFCNVTLPVAEGYALTIYPEAGNNYRLYLNGNLVDVVDNRVEELQNFSEYCRFGCYNRLTFMGDPIKAIEITPKNQLTAVYATNIEARPYGITVTVNVDRKNYGYEIDLGEDRETLNRHFRGFKSQKAVISGLNPDTDYYFRLISTIGGKRVRSEVYRVRTALEPDLAPTFPSYTGDYSSENWKEFAEPEMSQFFNGSLMVDSTPDYKILLKGGERWNQYEASVRLTLRKGNGNAGLLFNTTEPAMGPDTYQGYYFGLSKGGAVLGSASGSWNELATADFEVKEGEPYQLRVQVSDGRIRCFVNDMPVFALYNGDHECGSVGLRTYHEAFSADYVKVRPLAEDEISALLTIEKPEIPDFTVSARTAFELIQVTFPKIPGADRYRIDYGTSSGFYQNTLSDIRFNPYKGSAPFAADKTAFTFTGTTCYLRMSAWHGDRKITESEEIRVQRTTSDGDCD